jgi:HK97 family phage major capsid protein
MTQVVQDAVRECMEAFNTFKSANDALLAAKADGKAVSDLVAKVEATQDAMDRYENLNSQFTLAKQTQTAMQEQLDQLNTIVNRGALGGAGGAEDPKVTNAKLAAAYDRIMRTREGQRDPQDLAFVREHMATLVKGDDSGAGYLLAPPEVEAGIQRDVVELNPIRAMCSVKTISVASYQWLRRTKTVTAMRSGEVQPRGDSEDPGFGKAEILTPEMTAKHYVSQQMLEDTGFDLLGDLRTEVAEAMAMKESLEAISGLGNSKHQMEGFLSATAGLAETVTGDANKVKADSLITLYHDLKTAYARTAQWVLNRRTLREVRLLKDTTNQYLWVPGIATASPNTILGATYVEMPDMPDVAAGAYPIAFGDFKKGYLIVDRLGVGFQADYLTQADNGLVVYRARRRVGGGVKQSEAIRKLKVSA